MDSPRRPGSQEAELPRFAASLVGLVRSWQRQFGEVVQSWHLPANGQDNSACFQAPTVSFQHRKRRRRRNGRFAALSFGLDGAAARNRQPSMAIDGLCLGAGINGAKDNVTVSFPQPRRQDQERLLISEVEVQGVEGPLKEEAEATLTIRPNFAYTVKEVTDNMQSIFDIGAFAETTCDAHDTRDGVKLVFKVKVNPEVKGIIVKGANVLPARLIEDLFRQQYGKPLKYPLCTAAVQGINAWYENQGYVGQVASLEEKDGILELRTAEMQVGDVTLQYIDAKTGEARAEGVTRPDVILRQLCTRPGQGWGPVAEGKLVGAAVFAQIVDLEHNLLGSPVEAPSHSEVYNLKQGKQDIDAVYSMGIFEDVNIKPVPAEDHSRDLPKVDLTLNVTERKKMGGLSAGGGISAANHMEGAMPGFIGSASYSQRNLFGLNQKLTSTVEIGQMDSLFRISHTDPWVVGDLNRTSRSISLQNTRVSGNPIHGRAQDDVAQQRPQAVVGEGNLDSNVVVARMMGGVEWGRPLSTGWTGTLGINWQRARCLDDKGRPLLQDAYGSPLTFSGSGTDTMMLALLRAVYSDKADSQLIASMEQSLPFRPDWLNFNRFRLRVQKSLPFTGLRLPNVRGILTAKGGMIVGDLPPYEAFPIGGTNSVRGYSEGGVGSGRNYVVGTAEIQFPLHGPVEGTLFADYGHDLDSGQTVLGDPAGVRGKPGSGYGYGAGIRIDSPVGPLRFEYAFNDHGSRRFHLGIGSHG